MNRDAARACTICALSRAARSAAFEPFVHERAHHREQQCHQQRGGAAFAGDVAERQRARARRRSGRMS